jgi:hypothetical protein
MVPPLATANARLALENETHLRISEVNDGASTPQVDGKLGAALGA